MITFRLCFAQLDSIRKCAGKKKKKKKDLKSNSSYLLASLKKKKKKKEKVVSDCERKPQVLRVYLTCISRSYLNEIISMKQ